MLKKAAIGLGALLFFVLLAGLLNPAKPRAERIKEGCEREFADRGLERVQQCQLDIMTREMDARERAKMERAAQ